MSTGTLVELFEHGLHAPICLTWELTYACNLACVHCLSTSGRRDPGELSHRRCKTVIDDAGPDAGVLREHRRRRADRAAGFLQLVDYAVEHGVGVKFSTNGTRIDAAKARQLAARDYVDVQVSIDGATAEINDGVRGGGSYATAIRAMGNLADAGSAGSRSAW